MLPLIRSAVAVTVAALVALAAVVAAGAAVVALPLVMVVADGVGVEPQGAVQKRLHRLIRHADDAGIEHDALFHEGGPAPPPMPPQMSTSAFI